MTTGGPDRALLARLAEAPPGETRRLLLEATCQLTAEFLGLPAERTPGPSSGFLDLGFDSIRAVDFKVLLEERLDCRLRSTVLFDCPTPAALVDHLLLALDESARPAPVAPAPREADPAPDPESLDAQALRTELARQTARLRAVEEARGEPLAIVGLSCRFPGADDPEAFWHLQAQGVDAIRDVPADRWDNDALYDEDRNAPGKVYTRQAGFLADVQHFDARFFGIAPREAHQLDPQQRLLLEVTWEALERAGLSPDRLAGSPTGVFLGTRGVEYVTGQSDRSLEDADTYFGTGNSLSTMSGRISYVLGLTGPCYSLDTACSSALVAIHEACQSLRRGECSLALAGGVNMLLDPFASVALCRAQMLSPDDRCKTFDAGANGYVRGEGCGMIVLKRLSRARADGDRILALIRGTAINQDGASGGLTVPSGAAQQAVVRQALANGRLQPGEVDYVEAHGTGTSLGDPIEVAALDAVFAPGRPADQPLVVGSVKTNIGHLESAAGIAGLIKVVQMFEHGLVPPHLHLSEPSPHIPWDETVVEVPTAARPWPRGERPRRAGVNSFGFSGTNAHVVLEEPPEAPAPTRRPRPRELVVLSAHDEAALSAQAARLAAHLAAHDDPGLQDVAATLATGRGERALRRAHLARDTADLREQLTGAVEPVAAGRAPASPPRVAFLFTGQGSQQLGMAKDLARSEPEFAATLARCAAVLDPLLERPLLQLLWGDDEALLRRTDHAQPALFAVGVALARLWQSWGVEPAWVAGHSVGEFAAAVVAGVLELEDAARLIAARGRLMVAHTEPGDMLAVQAEPAAIEPHLAGLDDQLAVAALNAPGSLVLSGSAAAIATARERLEGAGLRCRPLEVSHAFHSPLMEPMLAPFADAVRGATLATPRLGFVSGLTGGPVRDELTDPDYWVRHVREPVRFSDAAAAILDQGCQVLIEIGPSPTLTALGQRQPAAAGREWLPSLRPGQPDDEVLLTSLARAWVAGVPVDWQGLHRGRGSRPALLPTYAFQRERFWLERRGLAPGVPLADELHPLLGRSLSSALLQPGQQLFETTLAEGRPAWLADHAVHESTVTPAAAYVEWALAAARQQGQAGPLAVDGLEVVAALVPGEAGATVQLLAERDDQGAVRASLHARAADGAADAPWELHARARVRTHDEAPSARDLAALEAACPERQDVDDFYQLYEEVGLTYGPAFRGLVALQRGEDQALATLVLPEAAPPADDFVLHPVLLDGCFQACRTVSLARGLTEMYLPLGIDRVVVHASPPDELRCHLRLVSASDDGRSLAYDLELVDAHGAPLVSVSGLRMVQASRSALLTATDPLRTLGHVVHWIGAERQSAADGSAPGRWLVLADDAGAGKALADELTLRGGAPLLASRLVLPLDDPSAWAAVLDELNDPHRPCRGVVHLRSLDGRDDAETLGASLLRLVQSLAVAPSRVPPRVYLVTRGAVPASGLPERVDPVAASLWGLGACLAFEHPEWRATRLDLDPLGGEEDLRRLCDELLADDRETQVAWRGGERRVARLERLSRAPRPALDLPDDRPWRLGMTAFGVLDNVTALPLTRRAPGPGEVEVAITHGALNFKDVLFVLGLLAEHTGVHHAPDQLLGLEGAGIVTALGEGVSDLTVGQRVMVSAGGCLASHVTTRREGLAPLPAGLAPATAAGVQTVFLTALYALVERAGLTAGETLLVHAGAGGVGQAAIAVARRLGARVLATASPAKWPLLEGQGVTVVGSTRDTTFAARVAELTDGRGVDVVLNSLAGEAIPASLDALAEGGRFVDIGKLGTWSPEQVAERRPDLAYHHFDMAEVLGDDPALLARLMAELCAGLADGSLTPPPVRVLDAGDAPRALGLLAQSRTVGKLVLAFPDPRPEEQRPPVRGDRSYLVTGGLGALGRAVGRQLAEAGAGRVVLCGRRGADAATAAELSRWPGRVEAVSLDVSDGAAVAALVRSLDPPLAGVVHAAGLLGDGMLVNQDRATLAATLAPKLDGARNLDAATAHLDLDHFVLFSSMVAMVGAQGQGPYGAANAALDALAADRRARGLAGLSIAWGPWAGAGMAATTADINRGRFADLGIGSVGPEQGLAALRRLMQDAPPVVGVLPVTWSRFLAAFAPGQRPPYLDALQGGSGGDDQRGDPILEQLAEADEVQRLALLDGFVRGQLARVMGHAGADAVDPTQEFADMGVDSLLAVDLRNRLEAALALSLPATLLFDHPTTEQVVAHLAGLVARGQADEEALLDEIEGLSAEEVERLLHGDGDD